GLDPTQIVEMRRLIRRLAEHSTVLFSSHILTEVEALCDRAVILMNGEVKADARLADLAATPDMVLVLEGAPVGVERDLSSLAGVAGVERSRIEGGHTAYRVRGRIRDERPQEGAPDLGRSIYDLARQKDWPLRELRRDVRTLEAVFNDLAMAG
ncbi:MAG: hypothetical protein JXA74_17330, partial [Anaerolineae bacterium]|nr:hypothetical protein [Anaerolineae bacterium]